MGYCVAAVQGTVVDRKDRTFGNNNTPVTDLLIRYKTGTSNNGNSWALLAQVQCMRDAHEQAAGVSVGDTIVVTGEVQSREAQSQNGKYYRTNFNATSVAVLNKVGAQQQAYGGGYAQQPQQYQQQAYQQAPQQQVQMAQPVPQPVQQAMPAPQPAPQAPVAQQTYQQAPQQQAPAADVFDEDIPF